MAFEGPQLKIPGLKAGADLSALANQYKFVKLDANGDIVIPTAATDVVIGVLQNRPKAGEPAEVCGIGVSKIQADAALAEGARIGTSADGQAVAKTVAAELVVGQLLTEAGGAGEIVTALINCANPASAV